MPRLPPHKRLIQRLLDMTGVALSRHREWERDRAEDPALTDVCDDGRPMPPPELITRVAATPSQSWFSQHGRRHAQMFRALAQDAGRDLLHSDVLDLGCGCGRIARWLAPETTAAGASFYGVDIQPDLAAWCATNLPGRYEVNRLARPVPLPDGCVDAVYAYSVITHLARPTTRALLADCARLLRPGGLALVTYQDESFGGEAVPASLARRGYVQSTRSGEGLNYMSAWVTAKGLDALCAPQFEAVRHVASDPATGHQAVAVLRRPG